MNHTHADGQGGSITILEKGSRTTPMRFRMVSGDVGMSPPAAECHPSQTEDFKVIEGTLDLGMVEDKHIVLKAGDTFHLPAGVPHHPRSESGTIFEATLTPGLETADMFTDLYSVFREHRGFGQFVRITMVMRRYRTNITFAAPISAVMATVAGIAKVLGVKRPSAKLLRAGA